MEERPISFEVHVSFEGVSEKEQPPQALAYVFDAQGQFLGASALEKGVARFQLAKDQVGRTLRLVIGPELPERSEKAPERAELLRRYAYEKRLRFDPQNPRMQIAILAPYWRHWLLCACVVRGRLVKRLTLPDGTTRELPICHARVTICEVDRIARVIPLLPDDILWRLRAELLEALRRPIRFPPPPPPSPFEPLPLPLPGPDPLPLARSAGSEAQTSAQPLALHSLDATTTRQLQVLSAAVSPIQLRRSLLELAPFIKPYLCLWDWLRPFFRYDVDCIRTVSVDADGRFETVIFYPCFGDKPDLYFRAEQWIGGSWVTIYAPSVACNTYWDYACGSEVVINVTNPAAIPCAPDEPVDAPDGVTRWVMPYAVGGSYILGNPAGGATTPAGWVKPNGLIDYSSFVNAPFGSMLGFRMGFSNTIPSGAIKYYRWSYRKMGTSEWRRMVEPVGRRYVVQRPGQLPTFPVYSLGPKPAPSGLELYEFKPASPPSPEPSEPPGTVTYWPTDGFFGDIYAAFLDTAALPPDVTDAAGLYQIKLEVFDASGNLVMPGGGSFSFIVPTSVTSSGTVARAAQAGEIDAGGFVFNLHIDNNRCEAEIYATSVGANAAGPCGFIAYGPGASAAISFKARHPNNFAVFTFKTVKGSTGNRPMASASGLVGSPLVNGFSRDANSVFSKSVLVADLLDGCTRAAFAQTLEVDATATNGWTRLSSLDANAVPMAFALEPEE